MLFKKWFNELTMEHTDSKIPSIATSRIWGELRKRKETKHDIRIDTDRIMDEVMAEVRRTIYVSIDKRKKSIIKCRSIIEEVKKEMKGRGSK